MAPRTRATKTTAATLEDVAAAAQVSLATASRVLNGSTRTVAASYRERVIAAAERLDYMTNLPAQATAKGSTSSVALVVADIADPYFSQIAAGVAREADRAGLIVSVSVAGREPDRELALVRALRRQRPRAMILASSRRSGDPLAIELDRELTSYVDYGGAVGFLGAPQNGFATAVVPNHEGARALAAACLDLGYRKFAAVVGPLDLVTSTDRLTGLREGLEAEGVDLPEERVVRTAFTREGGYAAGIELAERGLEGIEIVCAASDMIAIGMMSAFRDAGITPGETVAVCGFDDIATARDVTPALTTVRLPLERIGEIALRDALAGHPSETSAILYEVAVRASTPPR